MGYKFNLPFSKIVSDRWTLHFNGGIPVFPNAHQSRHLTNYNVGVSAIYAVSRTFGVGGKVQTDFPGLAAVASSVVAQPDGKIGRGRRLSAFYVCSRLVSRESASR